MDRDFFDKVAHGEINTNTEIFNEYLKYQNPIFLLKGLSNSNKTKNDKISIHVNNAFIDSRNAVNRNKIPKNKNSVKVIDIVEKSLNLINNKKEKNFLWTLLRVSKY